jgi:hypothetical protein
MVQRMLNLVNYINILEDKIEICMRQKEIIGAFVHVPIDAKYHTYGRIISDLIYAFYDLKTDSEISDLNLIEKSNVLFKLIVHKSA